LSFWIRKEFDKNTAVIDGETGEAFTYGKLFDDVKKLSIDFKSDSKKLFILFCDNSYETIVLYLSVLASGNCVMLLDYKLNEELKKSIVLSYKPEFIVGRYELEDSFGFKKEIKKIETRKVYVYANENKSTAEEINPELFLLLSTSGSTGSSKFVRLSQKNVESNAESICEYLSIKESDITITVLPIHYSYGLSVLNTHLNAGACVIVTNRSVIEKDFWEIFKKHNCSNFSGVPYTYQMMQRLKFHTMELPSLKYFTQAGGHLNSAAKKYFIDSAEEKKVKFIVMYGQTEATARISYLPFEKNREKIDSIGIAVPGGKLKIMNGDTEINQAEVNGEIVYQGDNVMLGYAESREDLAKGDEMNGVLHTGDLGYYDTDGFFFVTGRIKRFIKLFGNRINLDDVERLIESELKIAAAVSGKDDKLYILTETSGEDTDEKIKNLLSEKLKLHFTVLTIKDTDKLPVSLNGKKDYEEVKSIFAK
jgi:acyl-coenzyme A synthetase/AMP-(fatty) acid ligase